MTLELFVYHGMAQMKQVINVSVWLILNLLDNFSTDFKTLAISLDCELFAFAYFNGECLGFIRCIKDGSLSNQLYLAKHSKKWLYAVCFLEIKCI